MNQQATSIVCRKIFDVGDDLALFTGGYDQDHLNLVNLSTMAAVELQPVDHEGLSIDYIGWLSAGQAQTLYLVNEQTIHTVTVAEAVEAANG